jgi:hypothetical protein
MSYVPGNDSSDVILIAGAAALALGMSALYLRLENDAPGRIVGHCADGTVIGLFKQGVRRRPGKQRQDRRRWLARQPRAETLDPVRRRDDLEPGDLSFASLRPAVLGESGWILEGLGPRRETVAIAWEFETDREAHEVLQRLEERVVRPPHDDRGLPIAVTAEDLAVVRERPRET